jgi:hypothetical protein
MLKKTVLGILLVGLITILVAGGIIRTMDKTGNVAEARGLGEGHEYGSSEEHERGKGAQGQGEGLGQNNNGYRQGNGQGQGAGNAERLYPNYENPPAEWATYDGTVVESPTDGGELVIETRDGQEIIVGTGPGYMEAQGFVLQAGEQVRVQGYWEDNELKSAQVTRLRDGQTITLRDQVGRPAWAGSGKRANEQQAATPQGSQGQGEGIGQAEVSEWLKMPGVVAYVDNASLVVQVADGSEIVIEGRPWWFAQEQDFGAQVGDEVTLIGFYESGEFEVGQINNNTTLQTVQIREESGRPLWAGRGRRGG